MLALQTSAYRAKNVSRSSCATTVESLTLDVLAAFWLWSLAVLGFGAFVFPSVALIRMGGRDDDEEAFSDVLVLALFGRRGFWVRKTEPRAFWDVLERRSEREEKNWNGSAAVQYRQICTGM
jgi:hypothetical protein